MSEAPLNQRWAATLVGALVGGGVRHAVIAPGSRSTPLALAFAARPEVKCWSVIDERSAAFFGLGLSKSTQSPAAVVCTSGTAGAHFLPAIMEAAEGGTPLVVLTADRPWELHGFGAPQTITQVGLFGRYLRGEEALPTPDEVALPHVAPVAARLLHRAQSRPRGPVHFNVPFREPLAPEDGAPGPIIDPVMSVMASTDLRVDVSVVRRAMAQAKRGLIVCGPRERDDGFAQWVHRLGEYLQFPVLAEAASNVRFGHRGAISLYDALLRKEGLAAQLRPEVVLRFGGGLTAKGPQAWLDGCGAEIYQFHDEGFQIDPQHTTTASLPFSFPSTATELAPDLPAETSVSLFESVLKGSVLESSVPVDTSSSVGAERSAYVQRWSRAQAQAMSALEAVGETMSEPLLARAMVAGLPQGSALVLSSSMPIRDVDAFATSEKRIQVFSSRGVNGIDGVLSTALGVAAGKHRPTALLIGDVALLHDLSGWLIARRHDLSLTVVVINNDGGGIFHFLPVAERTRHFEALFGTPHGVDLGVVASLGGATLHRPTSLQAFRDCVSACVEKGLHLIEVRTDRHQNVAAHRELFAQLSESIQ